MMLIQANVLMNKRESHGYSIKCIAHACICNLHTLLL